jgi:hypothetical protein
MFIRKQSKYVCHIDVANIFLKTIVVVAAAAAAARFQQFINVLSQQPSGPYKKHQIF